ncbi:DgyrCDS14567 [Dimorphilus gyrociliatus]|uniref:DgyrCDS14567 n=1 Tax=Dimorphilus gyrociliatus TaxID=2664684 RepID=A0A7I8WEE7_9ANNE|nr:DgyrCDS14567 [Dimorphilus gyrociliatus]
MNRTCYCKFPFNNDLCSMGSKYAYIEGILSNGLVIGVHNLSSALDCIKQCEDMLSCETVGLGVYTNNNSSFYCSLISDTTYPIQSFQNNSILKEHYTIIFRDFELSVCGNGNSIVEHTQYCIEFLWNTTTGCPISGYGFIKNLEGWMKENSTYNLKNHIRTITSLSLSSNKLNVNSKKESYRSLCYGHLSVGRYNVALNKQVIYYFDIISPQFVHHQQHLVDGVKNSNTSFGGCTISMTVSYGYSFWVGVDLGNEFTIGKVVIYLSNNQNQNQFFDIISMKSYPPHHMFTPGHEHEYCAKNVQMFSSTNKLIVVCQPHTLSGRYVVLQSDSTDRFEICELELYTSNLALYGETLSSSVKDGNSYGGFGVNENAFGNSFQSIQGLESWIAVYLRSNYKVYGLDLSEAKFWELEVYVIKRNFFINQTLEENEKSYSIVTSSQYMKNYFHVACTNILSGSFVLLKSPNALLFKNLEIFGLFTSKNKFENIAYGKPIWTLEVQGNKYAYFATDGFSGQSYAMTSEDQYMVVDLLEIFHIHQIGIQMRSSNEGCKFRIDKIKILKVNIGRFILIKNSQMKIIELQELYVFGKLFQSNVLPSSKLVEAFFDEDIEWNIYEQDKSPLKAIDGDFGFSSCTTLKSIREDELIIKMKKKYLVTQILIQPRHDNINDIMNLTISVGKKSLRYFCGKFSSTERINYPIEINCESPIYGNYILITPTYSDKDIDICEVKVFHLKDDKELMNCSSMLKIYPNFELSNSYECAIYKSNQSMHECLHSFINSLYKSFIYNFQSKTCCIVNFVISVKDFIYLKSSIVGKNICIVKNSTC